MKQSGRRPSRVISRRALGGLSATAVAVAGGSGFFATHGCTAARAEGPSDKLNIAVVGLGGQGVPNLRGVKTQNIVALCGVDTVRAGNAFEQHPVHVVGSGPQPDPQRTPQSLTSRLDFPARTSGSGQSLPAVSVHWYQGVPPILVERGIDAATAKGKNTLFIGTGGMLICGFDGWSLLPAEKFADFRGPKETIPKSAGFHREWLDACRGGMPATCNFQYSGPLAESVLLANIAYRVQGKFDWDAASIQSNRDDVNALLRREYRRGWEVAGA